jgi:hypothetical protein
VITGREALGQAMRALAAAGRPVKRALAETDLIGTEHGVLTWLPSGSGAAVVLAPDGESIALDDVASGAPSPTLRAVLRESARRGMPVSRLRVLGAAPGGADAPAWAAALGLSVLRAPAWRWQEARAADWARAVDLLARHEADTAGGPRTLRRAAVLALVAGGFWIAASAIEWAWWTARERALERELSALAASAGARVPATDADSAVAAIRARVRERRREAGLVAPDDLLALLARASAAIGALPPGSLRVLSYEAQQVVIETAPLAGADLAALRGALEAAGIEALAADVQGATRVRLRLDPHR